MYKTAVYRPVNGGVTHKTADITKKRHITQPYITWNSSNIHGGRPKRISVSIFTIRECTLISTILTGREAKPVLYEVHAKISTPPAFTRYAHTSRKQTLQVISVPEASNFK